LATVGIDHSVNLPAIVAALGQLRLHSGSQILPKPLVILWHGVVIRIVIRVIVIRITIVRVSIASIPPIGEPERDKIKTGEERATIAEKRKVFIHKSLI